MSWTDAISLSFLPSGKLVTFTAECQAANVQYVQIIDKSGNPISYTDGDGNTQTFPVSGSGTQGVLFGIGSFTMQDGYKLQFQSSGSYTPAYIQSKVASLDANGGISFGKGTFFGTEDTPNGDPSSYDYNDTVLWLQSYEYAG